MEAVCSVCRERNTKYTCMKCAVFVCNICATPGKTGDLSYSEEIKRIALCSKCSTVEPPKNKIQKTIFSLFKPFLEQSPAAKSINEKNAKEETSKITANSRKVSVSTVETWKSELAEYSLSEWLFYDIDSNERVKNLKCKFCTEFNDTIKTMPYYTNTFIVGSANYRKSNILDHCKSQPHLKAYTLFLKKSNNFQNASKPLLPCKNNATITDGLKKMEKNDLEKTLKKFQLSYFIAKQQLPLSKFVPIVKLVELFGVNMGESYISDRQCVVFIDYIARSLQNSLHDSLRNAKFYSVLCDGSTDSSVIENEVVYALYFDPQPVGSDAVEIRTSFLDIKYLESGKAQGVVKVLEECFVNLLTPIKCIGFTSDGAALNRGDQSSVKTILRERSPWLVFVWCVAHRLELAIADALKDTEFDLVDEIILRSYCLYQKAPKKLRQLRELYTVLKDGMDTLDESCKPKKASGTRWISYKVNAMKSFLDKWGLYITHLEQLAEDPSILAPDKAKMKGYLLKWKKGKIPLLFAFFIDLLEIPSILSMSFQDDQVDHVQVMNCLTKAKERWYLTVVRDCIIQRVENEKESTLILKYASQVLNCNGWLREVIAESGIITRNLDFADEALNYICKHFQEPLRSAAVVFPDILTQWKEMLSYAQEFLSPVETQYRITWRRIFVSPRSKSWTSILTVAELLFTLPISNAKLERMFSKMKSVKSNYRTSLTESCVSNILRILEDGPLLKEFNFLPAIELWWSDKGRRPNQKPTGIYKDRV
ncbi:zinc finger protein 862-like [Hydra vulgaris]|uniref:zinc finger protein 862-like n=1 Tax=Hydra vulgaris TaxID=6087 RepID=UPI0032E9E41C